MWRQLNQGNPRAGSDRIFRFASTPDPDDTDLLAIEEIERCQQELSRCASYQILATCLRCARIRRPQEHLEY